MQDFEVFNGTTGDVITEQQLRETILIDNGDGTTVNADTKYLIKDGVSFDNITVFGEDLTAKGENPVIAANGKTVIKVNYKRHSYNLTFDLENGTEDLSYTVYYGASISLPENVRRQGYALTGWVPEFVDLMACEDTTYTAQWKANDYVIAFDPNEGEGIMENQPAVYDVIDTLNECAFTRTGYDFAGWAILRNGTIRYQNKENAADFLRSSWIRPEDVRRYSPWVDVVKLATRNTSSVRMILGAYTSERFDGNLFDLTEPCFSSLFAPAVLDNRLLDNVELPGLCGTNCTHCGKCEAILKQAMR
jgi:hypothetical protein